MTTGSTEKAGNALRYWRRQRGMSQQKVASALGINRLWIWAWETGRADPTRAQMERISEILDKPITMLFNLE